MKEIVTIFMYTIVLLVLGIQVGYSQKLEIITQNHTLIYQDSLAKTFECIISSDGPEASILWNAPSFKFLYSISDTLRIKQLVNHLGAQFLNDKIKRIVKKRIKSKKKIFSAFL